MADGRDGAWYSRRALETVFEDAMKGTAPVAGRCVAPILHMADHLRTGPVPPPGRTTTTVGHCIAATAHRSTPERKYLSEAIASLLGQATSLGYAVFVHGPIPARAVAEQLRAVDALAAMTIDVVSEADAAPFVLEARNAVACIDAAVPRNPWRLTWSHKALFRDLVLEHSAFDHATHLIYTEDDMAYAPDALRYWCKYRSSLATVGLLPGFLRVEGPEADRCVTGWRRRSDGRPRVGVRRADPDDIVWFVNLDNPYQAMYILDAELGEWHFRRSDFRSYRRSKLSPTFGGQWGVPERAASGPIFDGLIPAAFLSRNVLPLVATPGPEAMPLPASLIHHLPWKDYNNPDVPQGKVRVRDSFVLDPPPSAAEFERVIDRSP